MLAGGHELAPGGPPTIPDRRVRRRTERARVGYPPDMSDDPGTSPIGEAMAWVSRITAIGLAMFLPGVAGGWLDARLGTRFLGPIGFVLGLGSALLWLAQLAGRKGGGRS